MTPKAQLTFAGLVHDLNNVFQTILEASELVSSDPQWEQVAAVIQRSVEQAQRIVNSMAGAETGVAPVEQAVDMTALFAKDFSAAMKGPQLAFLLDVEPGLCTNLGAPALERVFMNLFINSAQAAKSAGREHCRISVSAVERARRVIIQVRDDGPGIPAHLLPDIFAPGVSTGGTHSGLGLHIVQSLVRSAGGFVEARNLEGGGAEFIIDLPHASGRVTGSPQQDH